MFRRDTGEVPSWNDGTQHIHLPSSHPLLLELVSFPTSRTDCHVVTGTCHHTYTTANPPDLPPAFLPPPCDQTPPCPPLATPPTIRQLSAYFHRFQSRLYPASARNVQLLLRLATSLERFLGQNPQQRHQQQSLSSDEGKSTGGGHGGGGHGGVEVFPKYDFLVHTRLDHLNLFHLLSWVQESRLVMKAGRTGDDRSGCPKPCTNCQMDSLSQ